jgi:hypothetical protein
VVHYEAVCLSAWLAAAFENVSLENALAQFACAGKSCNLRRKN